MNLSGALVGSATVSALFKCLTCGQDAVCEATIIVTGRDIPEDATEVSGDVRVSMPCRGCGHTSELRLNVPAHGDDEWATA